MKKLFRKIQLFFRPPNPAPENIENPKYIATVKHPGYTDENGEEQKPYVEYYLFALPHGKENPREYFDEIFLDKVGKKIDKVIFVEPFHAIS